MDYEKIAQQILQLVGNKQNIISVNHCFTRLRFQLKDNNKANREKLLQTEGVISVVESSGQYQVVLGNKVTKIYDALLPLIGEINSIKQEQPKVSIGIKILNAFAAIFTPIIPAIAASGMLKGILAIAVIIGNYYSTDIKTYNTYIILHAASDAVFYFMPIILGYTAAKVFKAHEFISMIIGATLCYPSMVSLMTSKSEVTFFAIELTKANYTSSVIPIIIAVFILSYIQRFLEKIIPEVLKIIMVPTFSLLIMIPATLLIFGPIGIYIGEFINWIYYYIMGVSPILLGAFIGGVWCILVIFGAHRAIVPIGINDVAQTGRQNLLAFAGAANFAQAGAAFGVFFKTKNKNLKTVAASATVTALFGITEPAIYGANLRLKRPMICAVICGAIAGGLMGWGGSYGNAFANQGVLTIPVYAEAGTKAFLCYLIGIGFAFFGSCIMTMIVGFNDIPNEEASKTVETTSSTQLTSDTAIVSPVAGEVIALDQVKDEAFASGAMGKGIAVYPRVGEIVAPEDCTVTALYPTLHAMGIKLDNGIELLIHIGIDTVNLQGKYFQSYVHAGQHITKGTKLVSFDIDKIKQQFDLTTSIIIVNSEQYKNIEYCQQAQVSITDNLLVIHV
ncbi:PTS system, beta-glucoside-specific IIB component / PTS system, beta-glucoside-specific IIC component / PTS system, beta-glucoside-specific IIA component [Gilliamella apicola]|uniref:beta-glucoside-specific PTS transporter subunit IIABC n=1 Tax=Gilliamella apicola TaxID=1196095 RepID=UPI00042EFB49|nr:beta-glucoside-specific PTS transporter subunit IIABC [Gilliamella apicola]AHN26751.1 PTS system, beta-glucoside-specific IIB component / PTS system, beta-glucoside-specific IIC component / PTS system, beta-glucoside-specific IIA component [Gilliamella apicola]PXV97175.1 PTS system beta-glucoside-specific IIA component (Glc family) /PTS system beta-glucoside-specific IIB component (Glc family) /PTS system beta-glucoside-specific IIC component (Glc family) [Gilliamella apicola]